VQPGTLFLAVGAHELAHLNRHVGSVGNQRAGMLHDVRRLQRCRELADREAADRAKAEANVITVAEA
jgi:hypothetical protein